MPCLLFSFLLFRSPAAPFFCLAISLSLSLLQVNEYVREYEKSAYESWNEAKERQQHENQDAVRESASSAGRLAPLSPSLSL